MKPIHAVFSGLALIATTGVVAADLAPAPERTSVVIHQTVAPVFPQVAKELGFVAGDVRVVLNLDEAGKLSEWLVVGYSHESFALSTMDAIKRWRFEPMRVRGEPAPAQVEVKIHFELSGPVVVSLDAATSMLQRAVAMGEPGCWPCTLKEIDRIPAPLAAPPPIYTDELRKQGVSGSAIVEFYIDERGAVRMPAVVRADFPELGGLAMLAVKQWSFQPATRRGRPVLVKVQQTFHFNQ